MENPNEYDDDAYLRAMDELVSAVVAMWEAGASLDNIAEEVRNGLDNEGIKAQVMIVASG